MKKQHKGIVTVLILLLLVLGGCVPDGEIKT